ncbi:restriction endonuclease subunit S [Psychrobacter arenosus]|uniref:restriction endonuclease subunit S n=1 Tax=Psychrobacter arenosus TaxID=256326 RepID=UPI001918153D|nr:restriction endonuclease subunit S [Psychrobacter arenosus]
MSGVSLLQSWKNIKLDEAVLKIVGGGTPSKSTPEYYKGDIPWMSVKDLKGYTLKSTQDYITQEAVENSATNIIPKGIPIVATRMSLGKIVIASFDTAINQDLKAIFLSPYVSVQFFVYWYRSKLNIIESLGTGTTVKGIRLDNLKNLEFCLYPLAEQKEIVRLLDTHLATVTQIQARLEAIPKILERFRQSVLADAVSGRLSGTEFNQVDKLEIGNVAELNPKKEKQTDDFEVSFSSMSMMSAEFDKPLGFESKRWSEVKKGYTFFKNNDVLLAKITPCFENGKSVIANNLINGIGTGSTEFLVIRCSDKVLPTWILYHFKQNSFIASGVANMSGSVGHRRVPKEFIESYKIYLPSLDKQVEIINRTKQLLAYAEQIEKSVAAAKARVDNLTQSILHQAFTGQLTAEWREQNPELISGDNSAEALLARIQAEG